MSRRRLHPPSLPGYRVLRPIGAGGLGDVMLARRVSAGTEVAIKVLRRASDRSAGWQAARRELEALRHLRGHAHVIQLEDVVVRDGVPFIVMEYAPGGSVAHLLDRRGGRLPVGEVVLIGLQTADALAAAHRLPVLHLDIKPHNLLIDRFGQVKVCDFGIAAILRSPSFHQRVDAVSQRFASPEQLAKSAAVAAPADVYMLGATMGALLTGVPPDGGRLAWQPPEELAPEVAARLGRLIQHCLVADPRFRPSAAQVHEELESILLALGPLRRRELPAARGGTGAPASDRRPTTGRPPGEGSHQGRRWPWRRPG